MQPAVLIPNPDNSSTRDNQNTVRSPGAVHTGLHPVMLAYKIDSPPSSKSPSSSEMTYPYFNKRNSLEPMSDYFLTLEGEVPRAVSLPGRYPARVAGHPSTDPAFHLDTPKLGQCCEGTRDGAQDRSQNPARSPGMTTRAANSWSLRGRLDAVGNTHLGGQNIGRKGEQ